MGAICICMAPALGVLLYAIAAAFYQFIMAFYTKFGLGYTVVAVMAGIGLLLAIIGCCIYGDHTTVYEYW